MQLHFLHGTLQNFQSDNAIIKINRSLPTKISTASLLHKFTVLIIEKSPPFPTLYQLNRIFSIKDTFSTFARG